MTVYADADQLQIRIQMLSVPSADQLAMMNEILEAASRNIDRMCRRVDNGFISDVAAADKYFTAFGKPHLQIPECIEITEVAVKASVTDDDYTAWDTPTTVMAGDGDWIPCRGSPDDPIFATPPYTLLIIDPNGDHAYFLSGNGAPVVKVTAKWRSPEAVPQDIAEATLMQAAIWMKQYQGSMSAELDAENFGKILYRRNLSQGVKQILIDGGWVLPLYGDRSSG